MNAAVYRLLDVAGDTLRARPALTLWIALGGEHAVAAVRDEALRLCDRLRGQDDPPSAELTGTDAVERVEWALDQLDADGDAAAAEEEAGAVEVPASRPTEPAPPLEVQIEQQGLRVQRLRAAGLHVNLAVGLARVNLQRAVGYLAGTDHGTMLTQLLEQLAALEADVQRQAAADARSLAALEAHALSLGGEGGEAAA